MREKKRLEGLLATEAELVRRDGDALGREVVVQAAPNRRIGQTCFCACISAGQSGKVFKR